MESEGPWVRWEPRAGFAVGAGKSKAGKAALVRARGLWKRGCRGQDEQGSPVPWALSLDIRRALGPRYEDPWAFYTGVRASLSCLLWHCYPYCGSCGSFILVVVAFAEFFRRVLAVHASPANSNLIKFQTAAFKKVWRLPR